MKFLTIILLSIGLLLCVVSVGAQDQQPQFLPIITSFTTDTTTLTLAEAEAGNTTIQLAWTTRYMSEDYQLRLYAYEIATWVDLRSPEDEALPEDGALEITVRHPLNFTPPSYRLIIMDEQFSVYSEAIIRLEYDLSDTIIDPTIEAFTLSQSSIEVDTLAYGEPSITAAWLVANRRPNTNLFFEQVLPNDQIVSVELPRRNLWVASAGQGLIAPLYPEGGGAVVLLLSLIDMIDGSVIDNITQQIAITGTLTPPTPAPTARPAVQNTAVPQQQAAPTQQQQAANPPPVVNPGTSGNFEIGGHIATFGRLDVAQQAGMTWVKKQIRWNRGEGVGSAQGIIEGARANGFKVLLGIVGVRDQMGDFDAYTDEFAAYLAQVAALGPDAIEVWNEPNIDREWPRGTISGANYTTMLAKAYNAIKATNPNVMVISGAPAPTGFFGGGCAAGGCDDNVFLRQMAQAGATQYMDCIGAHYNEGIISPDQSSGDPRGGHYSRYFSGMLNLYYNTFGGARRVCWTELGFLTPEGYSPLPGGFAWAQNTSLSQHADWLGRAARLSRDSGRVRLMIVWNVDFQVYDSDPQAGYAILRADGSCPACATLSAALR